jgi:hypothetical protein
MPVSNCSLLPDESEKSGNRNAMAEEKPFAIA